MADAYVDTELRENRYIDLDDNDLLEFQHGMPIV